MLEKYGSSRELRIEKLNIALDKIHIAEDAAAENVLEL